MGFETGLSYPTVVQGSRLKALTALAFVALLAGLTYAAPSPGNAVLLLICLGAGLYALTGLLHPGELTIDERGVGWRTVFVSRSFLWSEIAQAGVGSTDGMRQVYLQMAGPGGQPVRRKVWIPDYWSMGKAELADAINAGRRVGGPARRSLFPTV